MSRPYPFVTLATALKRVVNTPALRRRLEVAEISSVWAELVGDHTAQHVQPVGLEKGVLTLESDSAVWRQQLSYLQVEILEKITDRLGAEKVKQLRIK